MQHFFAAGVTLTQFTTLPFDDEWLPAQYDSTTDMVYKLAQLEFAAAYFDSEPVSLSSLQQNEIIERLAELVRLSVHSPVSVLI